MKCDMHVHTIQSGMCTVPGLTKICRESYSDPFVVYETLKRRGMGLVTVTDHDSIDSAETLRRYPDFVLSEEVSCTTPGGTHLHLGVYDIQERHHVELQRRRDDLSSMLAYLEEQQLLFSINHPFSALTGRRVDSDFALFASRFPAIETLNGHMPAVSNCAAKRLARGAGKIELAGSDAHVIWPLGRTYTEVAGARSKQEFFDGLRRRAGITAGESGSYWKLTTAVMQIACGLMAEKPATMLLLPLFVAIPLVTLASTFCEEAFARRWQQRAETFAARQWPTEYAASEAVLLNR